MLRVVLFLCSFFAFFFVAIASPLPPSSNVTLVDLERRVDHVGRVNKDSDPIVAISIQRYNSNGGSNCDQWVQITNLKNGKTAYGKTRDSCQSCGTEDLDMSPSLFQQLDSLSTGVLKIQWHFMAKGFSP
ncbi:hypothetical protein H0H81_003535 [Sphagnurus paluster]|uniref:RlpA-like protein double-psi beta-barrel domain-containing protein n=1 Tax=Sphagnurus paluster TaxID=117069 RepID=A0A9P7GN14_9AGAR|nr:hypothetical protein H0H81_003535 [Sphagnurus paluster]